MTKISFQFTPSEVGENDISLDIDIEDSRISEFGSSSYRIDSGENTYIIVSFDKEIRFVSDEEGANLNELLTNAERQIRQYLDLDANHFDLQIILGEGSNSGIMEYHSQIEDLADRRSLGQYDSNSLSSGNVRVSFSTRSIIV
ncbi:hypothetical protein EXE40_08675 [Halorubrum sp. GN11GM_10-3_MGM]|nr:hypothetical protein EXE40_08675 [Halorubrum sp. GN11GM_10-3_MGM]